MPKKCMLCKVELSPILKRSFHMFPKNEEIRKKWLKALDISETINFKTAHICSDHFEEESFGYTDEFRQRKRLSKQAVPNKYQKLTLGSSANETKDNCEVSDATGDKNCQTNGNENELGINKIHSGTPFESERNIVFVDVSYESHLNENVEIQTVKIPIIKSKILEKSHVLKNRSCQLDNEKNTNEEVLLNSSEMLSNSSSCSESNSKKRKPSFGEITPAKRVRFMDGFKTEYLCRDDFVTEDAWNRFIKFLAYQRSRIAAAHNKNSRKQKKIKNLSFLINALEKRKVFKECNDCSKSFTARTELKRHKKIHSGEKPYKCNYCTKTFNYNNNLIDHERIHTREKLYKCNYCSKSFNDKRVLTIHERIHTGEKLYTCQYCTKSFTDNRYLIRHKRIHTGKTSL